MQSVIQEISTKTDGHQIQLCYKAENTVAEHVYIGLGFVPISTSTEGVVTAQLTLAR